MSMKHSLVNLQLSIDEALVGRHWPLGSSVCEGGVSFVDCFFASLVALFVASVVLGFACQGSGHYLLRSLEMVLFPGSETQLLTTSAISA